MDKENEFSDPIKKRWVYYKGLRRRFRVISSVKLTKEEVKNITFNIRLGKGIFDENVIAREIVQALRLTNREVNSCTLSSKDGTRWVIKINVE